MTTECVVNNNLAVIPKPIIQQPVVEFQDEKLNNNEIHLTKITPKRRNMKNIFTMNKFKVKKKF